MLWNEAAFGRPFAIGDAHKIEGKPMMRGLFLGSLVFAALAAGNSAFAVETGPAANSAAPAPSSKQAANPKSKKRTVPLSAAFEATRTELPAASIQPRQSPSQQPTWTGIYGGVGGSAGVDR
jgi:hypothetical protein